MPIDLSWLEAVDAGRRAHGRVHRHRAAVLVQGLPRPREGDARRRPRARRGAARDARLRVARRRAASSSPLVLELLVGAVLGFLVFIVFSAVQSAGSLIDLFGGFTLAQAFDPQSMINGAQFTRLFQMTALALMFACGGYQLLIGGLTRSFDAFPLGVGMDLSRPVELMTHGVTADVPRDAADRRPAMRRAVPRRRRARPAHPRRAGAERLRDGLPAQDPHHPDARRRRVRRPARRRRSASPATRPTWSWG